MPLYISTAYGQSEASPTAFSQGNLMNWLDQAIAVVSPRWALSRARTRRILNAYEVGKPSRLRKNSVVTESPATEPAAQPEIQHPGLFLNRDFIG